MTFGLTIVYLRPRSVFYLAAFIDNRRLLKNVIERGCNFHRLKQVYIYQLIRPALWLCIHLFSCQESLSLPYCSWGSPEQSKGHTTTVLNQRFQCIIFIQISRRYCHYMMLLNRCLSIKQNYLYFKHDNIIGLNQSCDKNIYWRADFAHNFILNSDSK